MFAGTRLAASAALLLAIPAATAFGRGASARLAFDAADLKLSGGDGYKTADNAQGVLAWGESYVMMGYASMFRATGDVRYLLKLVDHARAVQKSRDDLRGLKDYAGKSRPCWQSLKYSTGSEPFCWVVHSGMITYPMADLALIVKQRPELASVPTLDGSTLGAAAGELVLEVEKTIATHEPEWKNGPAAGEGHYLGDPKATFTSVAGKALPLNQMNALGLTLVVLAQVTGKADQLAKAKALASYLRNRLTASGATWAWTYWGEPWTQGKGEDISHAAINVELAARAQAAGLVFSAQDLRRFARALVERVHLSTDTVADLIDGGGGTNTYRAAVGRWLPVAPRDARVWPIAASLYRKLAGASGSELAGLAGLVEHAPRIREHSFYHVDWQDLGDHRKATAYGANLLLLPPLSGEAYAFRLGYRAQKLTTLAQWDGKAYHDGIRLAASGSSFEQVFAPYDPSLFFAYSGAKVLLQLADSFVAGQGIEVKEQAAVVDPELTTVALPPATAGSPWSATLTGSGDAPLLWTLVKGPPALKLGLESGALSWTPGAGELPATLTVRLDNDAGEVERSFTIVAAAGAGDGRRPGEPLRGEGPAPARDGPGADAQSAGTTGGCACDATGARPRGALLLVICASAQLVRRRSRSSSRTNSRKRPSSTT